LGKKFPFTANNCKILTDEIKMLNIYNVSPLIRPKWEFLALNVALKSFLAS